MDVTYRVSGMTCGGCARSVTNAIRRATPEVEVEVDVDQGRVRVRGAHEERRVREAVEGAGFDFGGAA